MNNNADFTAEQLTFLQLFHIAAQYDCLYILDFYCMNEFDHDKVTDLSDSERRHLAELAEREIFEYAIENGYRPTLPFNEGGEHEFLC
ncbi:hypothetical protein [uncultured Roseibium sp.]|uniref:hypothetical protein n=1 Tax=uncultured Roseibium sp. TaxID=1936171 RepID=UPI00260D7CE7|nr:hypothetical protein [uncultured Roseibium sp.]